MAREFPPAFHAVAAVAGGVLLGALVALPLWGALAGLAVAHWRLLRTGRRARRRGVPARGSPTPARRERRRSARPGRLLRLLHEMAVALPEAVLLLDARGRITWANPRAAILLGIDDGRDRGRHLVHLVRSRGLAELLEHPVAGRVDPLVLDEWITPGRVLELRVAVGTRGTLVVARDVTREHRVADVRKAFVADVSHELYTPLTVITSSLEAMWDEEARAGPHRRLVGQMRLQAQRMSRLIRDLLDLSRLEAAGAVDARPVDVPAMLERLVAELRRAVPDAPRRIELQLDRRLHYEGDPDALRSVCSNLLRNALQHTPADGRVVLRWYECAAGVRFEVEDNGIGIEARHLPRLTERFYRVDRNRGRGSGGTGLGLSIVRHALLRHDAELEVRSNPGEGSLFRCRFPAARRLHGPEVPAAAG